MKVWIAESVAKKNRYGIYQSMSVLLIGIISVAVIAAAVWAGFSYNENSFAGPLFWHSLFRGLGSHASRKARTARNPDFLSR